MCALLFSSEALTPCSRQERRLNALLYALPQTTPEHHLAASSILSQAGMPSVFAVLDCTGFTVSAGRMTVTFQGTLFTVSLHRNAADSCNDTYGGDLKACSICPADVLLAEEMREILHPRPHLQPGPASVVDSSTDSTATEGSATDQTTTD